MAIAKPAKQGPKTYAGTHTADKAVDGSTSNAASSGACANTTYSAHSWWKVDLGQPYLLTGIKIYNRERGGMIVVFCLFCLLFIKIRFGLNKITSV